MSDLKARILAKIADSCWAVGPLAANLGAFAPSVRAALEELEAAGQVRWRRLGGGLIGWEAAAPPAPVVAPVAAPVVAPTPTPKPLPRAGLASPRPAPPRPPRAAPPKAAAKPRAPTRGALLDAIRANPAACGTELAPILGWAPYVVSKHARHLQSEGKIRRRQALRAIGGRRQTVSEYWASDAPEPPPTPVAPREGNGAAILALIGQRPGLTALDLEQVLGLGRSAVAVALVALVRDGEVVRVESPWAGRRGSPPLRIYLPADAPPPDAPPPDPRDAEIARLRAELAATRAELARLRSAREAA